MPIEYRKTHFSAAELQAALVNYGQRHDKKFPRAPIEKIEILADDQSGVAVHFGAVEEAGPKIKSLAFDREEVAAALIDYCRINKNPMSRAAKKVLEKDPDGIVILEKMFWQDAWDSKLPAR